MTHGKATDRLNGMRVLCAASLLCLLLGSIHAFSIFLEPLEARFSSSRSTVSLTYSFALVALTVAVLMGHRVACRVSARVLVGVICIVAAGGTMLAAHAQSLVGVWVGYSLLFGGANGLGYAFGLQSAAIANPGREGYAMGIVTAAYALGAALSPVLFAKAMALGGFAAAMSGLTVALIGSAPVCAFLMASPRNAFQDDSTDADTQNLPDSTVLLWICYGAGVAAGLMAIGHAASIASVAGWRGASWVTPALLALFNMGGSFAGGWLTDRIDPMRLLMGLPMLSASALLALIISGGGEVALAGLSVVGFAYGAIIAVFPATLAKLFGTVQGARVYGTVFTAWGTAGLFAPWLAGTLYDRTGGYGVALVVAVGLCAVSALTARRLSLHPPA